MDSATVQVSLTAAKAGFAKKDQDHINGALKVTTEHGTRTLKFSNRAQVIRNSKEMVRSVMVSMMSANKVPIAIRM